MVLTFLFLAGSFSYISYINIEVSIAGDEEMRVEFEEIMKEKKNRNGFGEMLKDENRENQRCKLLNPVLFIPTTEPKSQL